MPIPALSPKEGVKRLHKKKDFEVDTNDVEKWIRHTERKQKDAEDDLPKPLSGNERDRVARNLSASEPEMLLCVTHMITNATRTAGTPCVGRATHTPDYIILYRGDIRKLS